MFILLANKKQIFLRKENKFIKIAILWAFYINILFY